MSDFLFLVLFIPEIAYDKWMFDFLQYCMLSYDCLLGFRLCQPILTLEFERFTKDRLDVVSEYSTFKATKLLTYTLTISGIRHLP